MKPLHDKLARAMEEGDLPTPEAESPLQRFRRVLALTAGKVRPATAHTFTATKAQQATQISKGQQ